MTFDDLRFNLASLKNNVDSINGLPEWNKRTLKEYLQKLETYCEDMKPKKLYQSRVEIPRPLSAEEAEGLDKVYFPDFGFSDDCYNFGNDLTWKESIVKRGLAYRTPEEAIARAEAMLKVEEE